MQVHELIQGTQEWHQHRASHFNASDAPAMMGCSPYETRDQLIARLATGITPEVDAATQRIFDRGHALEAFARPLAVVVLGEDLFPVTGTNGEYSASFDGLTMDESIGWECKSLNEDLRKAMPPGGPHDLVWIPTRYAMQLEHQCIVSDATKVLFTATDGTDTRHCWYYPDPEVRAQIISGWQQLQADIDAYVPAAPKVDLVAETVVLPAVALSVSGALTVHGNLPEFHSLVKAYIDRLPKDPKTDQDFANLDQACKTLKDTQEKLAAAEANAMAQTASIEEMRRWVATITVLLRDSRLAAEKLVKNAKDARKAAIVMAAKQALHEFEEPLQERTQHHLPVSTANWEGVIRGLKTLDSIQSKVNNELARCKIEQMQEANRIERCLKLLDVAGMPLLFPDLAMLVKKQPEDLEAIIAQRKAKHDADVAEKEQRQAQMRAVCPVPPEFNDLSVRGKPVMHQATAHAMQQANTPRTTRPTDTEIIRVISDHYDVPVVTAREWLIEMSGELV